MCLSELTGITTQVRWAKMQMNANIDPTANRIHVHLSNDMNTAGYID